MAGFAGILDIDGQTPDRASVATAAAGGDGGWADDAAGFALAGERATQSADGRWVAAVSGSVCNRADLRRRLTPCDWRGDSDAETVAEAVARWGIERGMQAVDGPFAAALWDRVERSLYLVRDRFGEGRLVWGRCGGALVFATDLAALRRLPVFPRDIDHDALAVFLRLGFIPSPLSIHRTARKLPPATILSVKGGEVAEHRFWPAAERMRTLAGTFTGGPTAAAERLNLLLRASVAPRLLAGPPIGVLLSGAASSLVAAIARDLGDGPVHTFTFADGPAATAARSVASRLGTRHHEVAASDADLLAALPGLAAVWDEPFAHPGQIAACLLARAAGGEVETVLTGDGATALLGGSPLYAAIARDWPRLRAQPAWRRIATGWAARLRPDLEERTARSPAELLWRCRTGGPAPPVALPAAGLDDPASEAMAADLLVTLPDSACMLSERACAAAGVEVRRPFLDARLAEFAWSLPASLKLERTCLREVLCGYLPEAADRDSPPPLARWLAGPLAEWAGDLLSEDRLRRQGLIDPRAAARCRRSGRVHEIWAMLMAQAWMDSATP